MEKLMLTYRGDIYEVTFEPGPPATVVEVSWFIDNRTRQPVEYDELDYELQEKINRAIR